MNKEFAWVLGYLLSDGSIIRPKYRHKGDESHLHFICKYDDKEVLWKIKDILKTKANVHEYPNYKSPQAKIRIYDRKDIIEEYDNIKTAIPEDKIKGFERHFIRGLIDGDGTLSCRNRNNNKTFRIGFIDEYLPITQWVADTICSSLSLEKKNARWVPQNNVWEILWEGNIARLIAYWLYHGNIDNCCLARKHRKYISDVLDDHSFNNKDEEILYVSKAYWDNGDIKFNLASQLTLPWCHRVQRLISINTVPIFHNKGKSKYYFLYVPQSHCPANMRDALS